MPSYLPRSTLGSDRQRFRWWARYASWPGPAPVKPVRLRIASPTEFVRAYTTPIECWPSPSPRVPLANFVGGWRNCRCPLCRRVPFTRRHCDSSAIFGRTSLVVSCRKLCRPNQKPSPMRPAGWISESIRLRCAPSANRSSGERFANSPMSSSLRHSLRAPSHYRRG